MPEIGLDEEPISPVSRDDTVTNRNPNKTMSSAPSRFISSVGAKVMAASSTITPPATNFIDMSRSVRGVPPSVRASARDRPRSRKPSRKPCQMVGADWIRLNIPPAATAPAPM